MSIDRLKRDREEVLKEIDVLSAEEKLVSRKVAKAKTQLGVLNRRIATASTRPERTAVSDHALVRYLERIKGMDVGAAREEVCPQNVREQIETLGNGEFPVEHADGSKHYLYVRGGVVTTVTLDQQHQRGK